MTKTEHFATMDFATLCAQADGPIKKFCLIKNFGADLRKAGIDPYTLSCKEYTLSCKELEGQIRAVGSAAQ